MRLIGHMLHVLEILERTRRGAWVKTVMVYPLVKNAASRLVHTGVGWLLT
jgi:hypothetical protein